MVETKPAAQVTARHFWNKPLIVGTSQILRIKLAMQDNHTSIQADESIPPWEQPGNFRLDGAPHRGNLLLGLAATSFSLGLVAVFMPCAGWLLGLISLVACLIIHYAAKHDLEKMRTGLIDPRGQARTAEATGLTRFGIWLSSIAMVIQGVVCFLYLITHT